MEIEQQQIRTVLAKDLTEVLIRVGIIAVLVYMSVQIFSPFLGVVLWGLILAVTLYPMHQLLAAKIGGRQPLVNCLVLTI